MSNADCFYYLPIYRCCRSFTHLLIICNFIFLCYPTNFNVFINVFLTMLYSALEELFLLYKALYKSCIIILIKKYWTKCQKMQEKQWDSKKISILLLDPLWIVFKCKCRRWVNKWGILFNKNVWLSCQLFTACQNCMGWVWKFFIRQPGATEIFQSI